MLDLKSLIRSIPDYPKPGILFRDITTLIEHPQGFKESVERLADAHRELGITHVAGIEARGFIFGAGVAIEMGVGFVPIRKRGKLPGATIGAELHARIWRRHHRDPRRRAQRVARVLLIDDLIATGGTAVAAVNLLRRTGAIVEHAGFVIDLFDLGGAEKLRALGVTIESLLPFPGH